MSATSENNPFEEANEDHSYPQDAITKGLENTREGISDDTHAGDVDGDPALLESARDELEKIQELVDAD